MGIAERRAREKEELRSKILEAAGQLFVEQGFQNVSLRKIADRIEYSPATIYLYFRDKAELLNTLCGETFSQLLAALLELEKADADPLSKLRAGLRFYIDFGLQHPNHYLLTFCTPHHHCRQLEKTPEFEQTNRTALETFDCLRRSLQHCRQVGLLEFEDLELTAQTVWMFIHGTVSLLILNSGDPHFPWCEKEQLIENSLDLVLASLKCGARTGTTKQQHPVAHW
ncbi:MAG: TetR/AcrR family transcriptional regulator [Bryobacteraceae bacterium]|nr:TetR/AcrR family transcriptional regulator [Bryobacteraceae bacterium]MDW8379387.1 TetR/AcrR family transcriptional regulator [Bryobacterales bacterium]